MLPKLLIHQHVPVPRLARLHVLHHLVRLLQTPRLHPRLDLLIGSQLQHFRDLGGNAADGAAANLDAVAQERERVDRGQLASVGRADLDEGPVDFEQPQVARQGHLGARNGANDQIQRPLVFGLPVLLLVRRNVLVRPQLDCVPALIRLATNPDNSVGTKRFGKQYGKVPQAAHAHDADRLSRTTTILLQGGIHRDTAAEHGRRVLRG